MRTLLAALVIASAAPAFADDVGKATWSRKCSGCHGEDGKADTKMGKKHKIADFSSDAWASAWDAPRIREVAVKGVDGKMPAFQDKLSAAELDAVAAYVLTLSQPKK